MKERNKNNFFKKISLVFFILLLICLIYFHFSQVFNTGTEKNFFLKWLEKKANSRPVWGAAWLKFISRGLLDLEKHHPYIFFALECIFFILYIWLQVYYFKYSYKRGIKGKTLIKRKKNSFLVVFNVFWNIIAFLTPVYLLGYYLGIRKEKKPFRL
ncbi:hypothetical protein [Candidatus Phytoplasma pruni]|uniref:Uncharacterized protein n=1 Tax=Candidatus Phytoplasma pruni TaxID=479893 RepID=A0A851HI42_9MOLU|nr:hypothetical protein [Candidatus Phytoplasma pruni]NWN45483.1 hypothetical protein [Candidatus Phytoplasma pruni]